MPAAIVRSSSQLLHIFSTSFGLMVVSLCEAKVATTQPRAGKERVGRSQAGVEARRTGKGSTKTAARTSNAFSRVWAKVWEQGSVELTTNCSSGSHKTLEQGAPYRCQQSSIQCNAPRSSEDAVEVRTEQA